MNKIKLFNIYLFSACISSGEHKIKYGEENNICGTRLVNESEELGCVDSVDEGSTKNTENIFCVLYQKKTNEFGMTMSNWQIFYFFYKLYPFKLRADRLEL